MIIVICNWTAIQFYENMYAVNFTVAMISVSYADWYSLYVDLYENVCVTLWAIQTAAILFLEISELLINKINR